jgi:hypothetical protein
MGGKEGGIVCYTMLILAEAPFERRAEVCKEK